MSFRVNPLLSFFDKADGSEIIKCMQLYSYDEMFKVLDDTLFRVIDGLDQGTDYSEPEIKDYLKQVSGDINESDLHEFLTSEKIIIQPENDPLLKYSSDYQSHIIEKAYHESTRCYPFLYMADRESQKEDNDLMIKYLESDDYPSVYKSYNDILSEIKLNECKTFSDYEDVLNRDNTSFLEKISVVLGFCFGERSYRHKKPGMREDKYYQLELICKSVPLGGARHPTECYITSNGEHIPAGCYHYSVKKHTLEKVSDSFQEGGTFLVISSFIERAMWRYRDARSWRAIPCEIGHLLKLLLVVSAPLNMYFKDEQLGNNKYFQQILSLDNEEPIYSVLKIEG